MDGNTAKELYPNSRVAQNAAEALSDGGPTTTTPPTSKPPVGESRSKVVPFTKPPATTPNVTKIDPNTPNSPPANIEGDAKVRIDPRRAKKEALKQILSEKVKSQAKNIAKKAIPVAGAAFALEDAIDRYNKGDYKGIVAQITSSIVGFVPYVGTAAVVGIQSGILARDVYYEFFKKYPEDDPDAKENMEILMESVKELDIPEMVKDAVVESAKSLNPFSSNKKDEEKKKDEKTDPGKSGDATEKQASDEATGKIDNPTEDKAGEPGVTPEEKSVEGGQVTTVVPSAKKTERIFNELTKKYEDVEVGVDNSTRNVENSAENPTPQAAKPPSNNADVPNKKETLQTEPSVPKKQETLTTQENKNASPNTITNPTAPTTTPQEVKQNDTTPAPSQSVAQTPNVTPPSQGVKQFPDGSAQMERKTDENISIEKADPRVNIDKPSAVPPSQPVAQTPNNVAPQKEPVQTPNNATPGKPSVQTPNNVAPSQPVAQTPNNVTPGQETRQTPDGSASVPNTLLSPDKTPGSITYKETPTPAPVPPSIYTEQKTPGSITQATPPTPSTITPQNFDFTEIIQNIAREESQRQIEIEKKKVEENKKRQETESETSPNKKPESEDESDTEKSDPNVEKGEESVTIKKKPGEEKDKNETKKETEKSKEELEKHSRELKEKFDQEAKEKMDQIVAESEHFPKNTPETKIESNITNLLEQSRRRFEESRKNPSNITPNATPSPSVPGKPTTPSTETPSVSGKPTSPSAGTPSVSGKPTSPSSGTSPSGQNIKRNDTETRKEPNISQPDGSAMVPIKPTPNVVQNQNENADPYRPNSVTGDNLSMDIDPKFRQQLEEIGLLPSQQEADSINQQNMQDEKNVNIEGDPARFNVIGNIITGLTGALLGRGLGRLAPRPLPRQPQQSPQENPQQRPQEQPNPETRPGRNQGRRNRRDIDIEFTGAVNLDEKYLLPMNIPEPYIQKPIPPVIIFSSIGGDPNVQQNKTIAKYKEIVERTREINYNEQKASMEADPPDRPIIEDNYDHIPNTFRMPAPKYIPPSPALGRNG